jgi:hypothetical protein
VLASLETIPTERIAKLSYLVGEDNRKWQQYLIRGPFGTLPARPSAAGRNRGAVIYFLRSTACQPVLFGSLPKSSSERFERFVIAIPVGVVGKLPTTTGWQPVAPRIFASRSHACMIVFELVGGFALNPSNVTRFQNNSD